MPQVLARARVDGWSTMRACVKIGSREEHKIPFVALQKRFSGLRICRWVSSFSTVFIVLWQLWTFPRILPDSIAARASSSMDGRTAAHRNHSCANMKGIGLTPIIFFQNTNILSQSLAARNTLRHWKCQCSHILLSGHIWSGSRSTVQVPGRFSSRSTHSVDFTAYNLAEVTKHKSFANLDAEGWSVLVVCFKQSSNMFVTNSMFCWVLGGFGGLAMSGFSPFSIKSVRGRTFTDKNASLPGSRSQQFSYKLPGQQSWLHKPFLENVGVNRVAAEFQDRFCCNGNSICFKAMP